MNLKSVPDADSDRGRATGILGLFVGLPGLVAFLILALHDGAWWSWLLSAASLVLVSWGGWVVLQNQRHPRKK